MLINQENIQQHFDENREWATEIDLETAWATSNAGLRSLQAEPAPGLLKFARSCRNPRLFVSISPAKATPTPKIAIISPLMLSSVSRLVSFADSHRA